jgi:xylulose-5-phosphate/fructose-6-phosphate phosphoketolase
LNRLIKEHDADIIYISGPGHGGPSLNACSYLEGTYTEAHPEITRDEDGLRLIHTLVHGRANEARFHVHGYMDQGTTTTPFDMVVLNEMSRFHLALDALKHIPRLRLQAENAINFFNGELHRHHDYIREHLEDMPEVMNWQWTKDFSDATASAPLAKGHPQKAMFTDS